MIQPRTGLVQVPVLADELAQVSDPRRREGRRYDLVFLLLTLVAAVLTGASSISQVLRWACGLPPQTLRVLARGGPTTIPANATFSRSPDSPTPTTTTKPHLDQALQLLGLSI